MKGSILVYGSTRENRNKIIDKIVVGLNLQKTDNTDLLRIEKPENRKSIGIEQIRRMKKFVYEKPFEHKYKAVVIEKADLLTNQAQNALLKTLEETPSYATIVLSAKTESSLLETIISRCKRINAVNQPIDDKVTDKKPDGIKEEVPHINTVLKMSLGERLAWAEEFSKKDTEKIVETLEEWAFQLHANVINSPKNLSVIEEIVETARDIEKTNINTRLAVEKMALNI